MKIRNVIILSFLILVLVLSVGSGFAYYLGAISDLQDLSTNQLESLAEEKAKSIENIVHERIHETKHYAQMHRVTMYLINHNRQYEGMTEEKIIEEISLLDQEWIEEQGSSTFVNETLSNELSQFLSQIKLQDPLRYGEIFITDKFGATVASTNLLTDYYQADEFWWTNAKEVGYTLDDRGFDQSTNSMALGVVLPMYDGEEFIGMIKVNYNTQNILSIVEGSNLGETGVTFLLREDGSTVLNPSEHNTDEYLSQYTTQNNDFSDHSHDDVNFIFANQEIELHIHHKSQSGWEELNWLLVLEQEEEEVLGDIKRSIFIDSVFLIAVSAILLIVVGLFVSHLISKPISEISSSLNQLSHGKLMINLPKKSNLDEVDELIKAINRILLSIKIAVKKVGLTKTEMKLEETQKELTLVQTQAMLLESVVEQTGDAVLVTNIDGHIEYVNKAFQKLCGYKKSELVGKNPRVLKSGTKPKKYYKQMWDTLLAGKVWRDTITNKHKNGKLFTTQKTITPIKDNDGEIRHFVSIDRKPNQFNPKFDKLGTKQPVLKNKQTKKANKPLTKKTVKNKQKSTNRISNRKKISSKGSKK